MFFVKNVTANILNFKEIPVFCPVFTKLVKIMRYHLRVYLVYIRTECNCFYYYDPCKHRNGILLSDQKPERGRVKTTLQAIINQELRETFKRMHQHTQSIQHPMRSYSSFQHSCIRPTAPN